MLYLRTALVAFLVVLFSLGALALTVWVLCRVARARRADLPEADSPIPAEVMAVIAAAVHTALGARVRLHRVHLHREAAVETWSRAGRMDVMMSHRLERRR